MNDMEAKIKEYVVFKLNQYSRTTGITDLEEMNKAVKANLKSWTTEAMKSYGMI